MPVIVNGSVASLQRLLADNVWLAWPTSWRQTRRNNINLLTYWPANVVRTIDQQPACGANHDDLTQPILCQGSQWRINGVTQYYWPDVILSEEKLISGKRTILIVS